MAEVKQYVFFDFEMLCSKQGMPYEEMEAIRLGAVKQNLETGEIAYFDRFIRPIDFKRLSAFCIELTGITNRDIRQAESFKHVFEDFLLWVGGLKRTRFFSWSKNDLTRLILDAEKNQIASATIKKIEKRYIDFQAIFAQRVSRNPVSVENALQLYGLSFAGTKHNPMYDALNTLHIYQAFLKRRVDSDRIMLRQFIFEDSPYNLEHVNDALKEYIYRDIQILLKDLRDIYSVKDGKKILKRTQRLATKYSNLLVNRSGLFSMEVLGLARSLISFYHELLKVFEEHTLYFSKIMILPDGLINFLRKQISASS